MKFLEIKLAATIAIAKLTRHPIIQWKRKRDFWFKYQSSSWFYDWVPCHTTILSNLKLDQLMYDVGVISSKYNSHSIYILNQVNIFSTARIPNLPIQHKPIQLSKTMRGGTKWPGRIRLPWLNWKIYEIE